MGKTFGECRREWLPGESDNINYCIPVIIGVVGQAGMTQTQWDEQKLDKAIDKIIKKLRKNFGKFKPVTPNSKQGNNTHHQLIVMKGDNTPLTKHIAKRLEAKCGAELREAKGDDGRYNIQMLKKYCWLTIGAWDGDTTSNAVYSLIKYLLSYDNTQSKYTLAFKLAFPQHRPVYQIALPVEGKSDKKVDYTVREIYPYPLETIPDGNEYKPWFCRENYHQNNKQKKTTNKRRKVFRSGTKKVKSFNKKIIKFSWHVDKHNENIYDLLPLHHLEGIVLPKYVEIANLREIFYDVISMQAQKKRNRGVFWLVIFAMLCMVFFNLYSDWQPLTELLWGFTAFFALVLGAYALVHWKHSQNDYLDFRALAEGMRVQCHWYAANIVHKSNKRNQTIQRLESVGSVYTVKFQKDMQWAQHAFNAWYLADYQKPESEQKEKEYRPNYDIVKAEWLGLKKQKGQHDAYDDVEIPDALMCLPKYGTLSDDERKRVNKSLGGQYGFYFKRINEKGAMATLLNGSNIAFKIAWIIASVILIVVGMGWVHFMKADLAVLIMGLISIVMFGLSYVKEIYNYQSLVSKYSYCVLLAQKALQDFETYFGQTTHSNKDNTTKDIFYQYGVEALEENAEWLMINDDREPGIPIG